MPGAFLQKTLLCVVVSQKGLPRWLSGKEPACQRRRRMFNLWVKKIPGRRKWQRTPVSLPGKLHEQRSLADYSPQGRKEWNKTEWLSNNSVSETASGEQYRLNSPSLPGPSSVCPYRTLAFYFIHFLSWASSPVIVVKQIFVCISLSTEHVPEYISNCTQENL